MIKLPTLKTLGIVAVILLLLYAWGVTKYALTQKEEKEFAQTERDEAVAMATNQKEETYFYLNAYNYEVAKVKSAKISIDNLNRMLDAKEFSWLKQFESLKKKYQNLEQATSINMSFRGDSIIRRTIYMPCADTVKLFRYYIHDEFNHIDAVVLDTPVFQSRIPINIVGLWERKKFLGLRIGKKEWFIEATTPNKLYSIDSLVNYTIRRRRE